MPLTIGTNYLIQTQIIVDRPEYVEKQRKKHIEMYGHERRIPEAQGILDTIRIC